MNTLLRAVHVEDEPLCRDDLRSVLRLFPEVSLVGEADSLPRACRLIEEKRPDLLFLDLSLGREKGFHLLQQLQYHPLVIAITAHAEQAVDGFSLDLVDFVLKPVEIERLRKALDRARHRLITQTLITKEAPWVAEIDGKKTLLTSLEIFQAEAEGNYVILYSAQGKGILRSPFHQVEEKLSPHIFLKVSRSCIVAISQIQSWSRRPDHSLCLHCKNGTSLSVARRNVKNVLAKLTPPPPHQENSLST